MAIAYLNEGATSFAAGNWSDGVGFGADASATHATLVVQTPGNQVITASLDHSLLTDGVESFDVYAPFAGFIGSGAESAKFDADGTAYSEANRTSRVRYWAAGGSMYYNAGGGSTLCHICEVGGAGKMFLTGGIFTYVVLDGGAALNVNQSTTFTDAGRMSLNGGTSFIDTHASDLIGMILAGGGTHTIKRGGVAATGILRVSGTANVTLDAGAGAWPLISVDGGSLTWISAAAPSTTSTAGAAEAAVEFRAGLVDFSRMTRAVSITARTHSACTIKGFNNPLLTLTQLKVGAGAQMVV